MPGARVVKVGWARNLPRYGTTPKTLVLHVAASTANGYSIGSYFARTRVACSHFYVDYDGTIYQYQPIKAKSGADYGARHTVSVESQGGGEGKWTTAQLASLARIAAWCEDEWDIPLSAGAYSSSRGVITHRHGCDGNFPKAGVQRGRLQRGAGPKLSGAYGKICPGYERQDQYLSVVDGAVDRNESPADRDEDRQPVDRRNVRVDGKLGSNSIKWLQRRLKQAGFYDGLIDGEIDSQNVYWRADNPGLTTGWNWRRNGAGSKTVLGLQRYLKGKGYYKGKLDGLVGPKTIKALQRFLKKEARYRGKVDGEIWKPSGTVRALQRVLNSKKGFKR